MKQRVKKDFINAYVEFNTFISLAHTKISLSPCRRTFLIYLEMLFRHNFAVNLNKFIRKNYNYEQLKIPIINENFDFSNYFSIAKLLKYYNIKMLEYISKISSPILALFNDKLKECTNDEDIDEFVFIYSNLFWLLCMQIEGIDISCNNLKESAGCQIKCDNIFKPSNVIKFYIVPEYATNPCVSNKIISTFNLLKKNEAILIVDYTNICDSTKIYKWEDTGAYDRYEISRIILPNYFYNCSCVDFGKYFDNVKKFIIPDRKSLNKLIKSWRDNKKLLFFDE